MYDITDLAAIMKGSLDVFMGNQNKQTTEEQIWTHFSIIEEHVLHDLNVGCLRIFEEFRGN